MDCKHGPELDMTRLDQLLEMLKTEPDDTFLNYALALEYDKLEKQDESLRLFQKLMALEPPYVPAFFMAGQMLQRLDRTEEASTILTSGIAQAQQQGNSHAAGEMREFLAMIND